MHKITDRLTTGVLIASIIFYMLGYISYSLLLLLWGSVFAVVALRVLVSKRNIIKYGEYADAVVIETICKRMRRANTYIPVLEYEVDGCRRIVQYHGHAKPKYEDGEIVKIIYNRESVENVVIVGDSNVYIFSTIFGIAGLAMICGGLYMYFT